MLPLSKQKPLLRIISLGEELLQAIVAGSLQNFCAARGLAQPMDMERLLSLSEDSLSTSSWQMEYESASHVYEHVVPQSRQALSWSLFFSSTEFSGALWAIETRTISEENRAMLRQVKHFGVREVIVLLTHPADEKSANAMLDPSLDRLETEIREALQEGGFFGNDALILRGSASDPAICEALLRAFDERLFPLLAPADGSFFMPIEDAIFVPRKGMVIAGRIARGKIKYGDSIELLGIKPTLRTTVVGLEKFRKVFALGEYAEVGQNIGMLLRNVERDGALRGQVAAAPGSLFVGDQFDAEIYCYTKAQGGPAVPLGPGDSFYVSVHTWTGYATVENGSILPGQIRPVSLKLEKKIALSVGFRFAVVYEGRSAGVGSIGKIRG